MEIKAKDRNEVKGLLNEASRLYQQDPNNQELKAWVNRFTQLLNLAQASGEGTVNEASMLYMYVRVKHCPKCANWSEVIARLKANGRPIYQKATETSFLTDQVISRAKCMINFSIRSVEADERGWGVYRGREGEFAGSGGDFDVDCEPRDSFHYTSKGEPDKPTDMGLNWIEQVREEARWWKFSDAEQDATELMEEFYKDSMCKTPPNGCDKGHRHYKKLAERYNLPKAVTYNKGFYATIYGKVEVVSSSGRNAAKGAEVTVTSPLDGESWHGSADNEGNYEIKNVLLHKECMPFKITARYGQEEAWDVFYGPLEKPDPSYRYEKNIDIRKVDILGQASVSISGHTIGEPTSLIYKVNASARMIGTWKYSPEESTTLEDVYVLDTQKISYFFFEEAYDHPGGECPDLYSKLSGNGDISLTYAPRPFPSKRLIVVSHDVPAPFYELHSSRYSSRTQLKKVYGKIRSSYSEPECQVYEDYSREIGIGFGVRGLLGTKGEMRGEESWKSCTYDSNGIGFGIDYLGAALLGRPIDYSPRKWDEPCGDGNMETNIHAQWFFKKIKMTTH